MKRGLQLLTLASLISCTDLLIKALGIGLAGLLLIPLCALLLAPLRTRLSGHGLALAALLIGATLASCAELILQLFSAELATALALFLAASVVAVVELEIINYVEHYGLQRLQLPDGRFEPVTPAHSWNANTGVVNAFLFNLQRHADHHAHAGRDYLHLRSLPQAPTLPLGYGAMVLVALLPPLWRRLMDARLARTG